MAQATQATQAIRDQIAELDTVIQNAGLDQFDHSPKVRETITKVLWSLQDAQYSIRCAIDDAKEA